MQLKHKYACLVYIAVSVCHDILQVGNLRYK